MGRERQATHWSWEKRMSQYEVRLIFLLMSPDRIMQTKRYKIAYIKSFDQRNAYCRPYCHTRIIVHNSEFCNLGKILWMNIICRDFITSPGTAVDVVTL